MANLLRAIVCNYFNLAFVRIAPFPEKVADASTYVYTWEAVASNWEIIQGLKMLIVQHFIPELIQALSA